MLRLFPVNRTAEQSGQPIRKEIFMSTPRTTPDAREVGTGVPSLAPGEPVAEQVPPWEQIAAGRYMPRRIRGSCVGRELG
jgi:hypothetical protein